MEDLRSISLSSLALLQLISEQQPYYSYLRLRGCSVCQNSESVTKMNLPYLKPPWPPNGFT